MIGGAISGIVWRLLMFVLPVALGQAIDKGVVGNDREAGYLWCGVALVIALLLAFASTCRHWFAAYGFFQGYDRLRRQMLAYVQSLDLSWHNGQPRGEVLARVTSDARVATVLLDYIPSFSGSVVSLIAASFTIAVISPELAVVAFSTIPLILAAVLFTGPRMRSRANQVQESIANMTGTLEETIAGVIVVKSLGAEETRMAALTRDSQLVKTTSAALERARAALSAFADFVPALAISAGLFIGGHQVANGDITLGELTAFIAWMVLFTSIISNLASTVSAQFRTMAAVRRLETVLANRPRAWGNRSDVPEPAVVELEHVSLVRESRRLLSDVSLRVEPGERLALLGATGSGKSTLLAMIPGLITPTDGSVRVSGIDLHQYDRDALRARISLVPEEAFIFEDTVRENLSIGLEQVSDDDLWAALRLADVDTLVASLEGGLDHPLGNAGREVSGGEAQRLCLARALVRRPLVLLLDDALSAVDGETEQRIVRNLAEWPGTIIFSANRPGILSLAGRTVRLESGRLEAVDDWSFYVEQPSAVTAQAASQPADTARPTDIVAAGSNRSVEGLASGENVEGVLGRAWPQLKPFVPRMMVTGLLSILATACLLLQPQVIKMAVDNGIVGGDTGILLSLALAFLGLSVVTALLQYGFVSYSAGAGEEALHMIRTRTWNSLHRQPLSFFESRRTGELLSRATDDIQDLSFFVRDSLERVITFVTLLTLGLVFMFATSVPLTLAAITGAGLNLIGLAVYQRLSPKYYSGYRQSDADVVDTANQSIGGITVVQVSGGLPYVLSRITRASSRFLAVCRSMVKFENVAFFPIEFSSSAISVVVIIAGIVLIERGTTTAGTVIAFMVYVRFLLEPLSIVTEIVGATQKSRVAMARLLSLQELPQEVDYVGSTLPRRGGLSLRDVSFRYSSQQPVLDGVNLDVSPGRRLAIIGQTGAGKSTLAKLIAGLEQPTNGRVELAGYDIHQTALKERRRAIAYISQGGQLFSGSIADNLRLAQPEATESELRRAITDLGISDFIDRLPAGMNTYVGRQGALLSAGERQLVAVARLGLLNPAVIILDESTSRIDEETERDIDECLNRLGQERTVIVIAHRPSTIGLASDVMELRRGELVTIGSNPTALPLPPEPPSPATT